MFPSAAQMQRDGPLEPLDTFDIQTLREPEWMTPALSSLPCCVCLCCSVTELFMSELLLKWRFDSRSVRNRCLLWVLSLLPIVDPPPSYFFFLLLASF